MPPDEDDEIEEPELKRPVSENMDLMTLTMRAEEELSQNALISTKKKYARMQLLALKLENHAEGYRAYEDYKKEMEALNNIYGDIDLRDYVMRPDEAQKRFRILHKLGKNIGTYMIDSRYINAPPRPEDYVEFSGFWEKN